ENPAWQGDAVAWFNTLPAANDDEAAHLLARGSAAANAAVVNGGGATLNCVGPCPSIGYTVERPRPEEAMLAAQLPRDAVVALDEQDDGHWHATVDGTSASTVTVDGFFVGVRVPVGAHVVHFEYEAPGLRLGLWLAMAGGVLVLLALARAVQEWRAVTRSTRGPSRLTPNRSPTGE
ncbi:MAG TPA: YfhO family protein, partial [Acidimicrobiales bacterium]|nr:YfhO family protein [Acidimicrobiales bacterium]